MTFEMLIPIVVGLLAIAGTYWNATRLERKKADIALLNDKLGKLYGPLYALSGASRQAWLYFREHIRPGGAFFDDDREPPTERDLIEWRLWMTCVFMPTNERMIEAIVGNLHLIEGSEVPPSFLKLIAHVEAYRVIRQKWAQGDFSEHATQLNFPIEFQEEVAHTFGELKQRQALLIGGKIRSD